MYPPIFSTCKADSGVTSILGNDPLRFYPFGSAGDSPEKPYAVWQVIAGIPGNYLAGTPDVDSWKLQIDVYGDTVTSVRNAGYAIQAALEPAAYVVSYRGEMRDPQTRNYRYSFDVSWIANR